MGDAEKVGDGQNSSKDKRVIQSDNIPPNEILDRVANLLDSNVEGFTSCRIDIVQVEEGEHAAANTAMNKDALPLNNCEKVILEEGESSRNVTLTDSKTTGKQVKNEEKKISSRKAKADYYIMKKKILAAKSDEMVLQNQKLKLEIEALKQKNKILKKIKPIKLLRTLYS